MNIIKTILIAIIQGLTEFLPVSSSGHIFLLKNIMNLNFDATFDVFLHGGTLLAVVVFYRKEIYELISGIFKNEIQSSMFNRGIKRREIIKVYLVFLIATIPAAITGVLLEDKLDFDPSNTPKGFFLFLAFCFLFTAILLFSTKFVKNNYKKIGEISFLDSLIIGVLQSISVLYGVSRSASTICSSLYLKVEKEDASRFSFLLSIPIIFGALLLKVFKLIKNIEITEILNIDFWSIMIIGVFVSFITGFIAIKTVVNMLKKEALWKFSIYMIIPIIISLILFFLK